MTNPIPTDDPQPVLSRGHLLRKRIRWITGFFIFGLAISGATAIPLTGELNLLANWFGSGNELPGLTHWLLRVQDALAQTQLRYPFMFYGTDWLAF
jgi:hypothetical protein